MAFNRTYPIYIRGGKGAANSLITSLSDSTVPSAPEWVPGDEFTLAIYFCDEPASNGAPFTSSQVNAGDVIVVAGRPANNLNEAELLFSATPFVPNVDGSGNYYYTALLNLNTAQIATDMESEASNGQLSVLMAVQVQDAANDQRQTFEVTIILTPKVYQGTEGTPPSGDPTYPAPSSLALVTTTLNWNSAITGTVGGGATNIDGIATVALPLGYAIAVVLAGAPGLTIYELIAGAAVGTQIAPTDYNAGSNNKCWAQKL